MRYYPRFVQSVAQSPILSGLSLPAGIWTAPQIIGTVRIWEDTVTGVVRVKYGSDPTTEIDGNELAEGL
jgi:hypothetical protein